MSDNYDYRKTGHNHKATTWVYDENIGWIDINQYLRDVKQMLKRLNTELKKIS
ncbi:MAG: hypothetical protein PHP51_08380 [Desulfotomaculaceae bacterium]|nr:hypothetical protein [Desulfotomaculaceae bacterium]